MRLASRAGLATCLLFPLALLAAEPAATVTLLDGGATVIRGTARYALAEGVRIAAGDIVETGDEGIAIIEFPDGVELGLGRAPSCSPSRCRVHGAAREVPRGVGHAQARRIRQGGRAVSLRDRRSRC